MEQNKSASPAALTLLQEGIECMEARNMEDCDWVRNARALLAAQPAAPAPADRQGVALSVNDALREWADEVGKAGFTRPNAGERVAFIDGFNRASSSQAEVEIPAVCDGKEQEEFEAWAKAEGFNMTQHLLHYLFLNPLTHSARMGWKGAIEYCAKVLAAAEAPNAGATDADA